MMSHSRPSAGTLRRVLENAGLLIFASLLVMSLVLGRYTGALVWCGALLVFFAHAWEGRSQPTELDRSTAAGAVPTHARFNLLRWIGVVLALTGAVALAV